MPSRNPEGEHFRPVHRAPRLFQTWTVVSPVPVRIQAAKKNRVVRGRARGVQGGVVTDGVVV